MAFSQYDLNEERRFIDRIRFPHGEDVNLAVLQEKLQDECDANGIPVAFRNDTLKAGSLFSKQVEDVIVLYNTDHPNDYLRFLIRITHQGKYAFLDVFKVGCSQNYIKHNKAAKGSITQGIFNTLLGQSQSMQEEENFYTILTDCFGNIMS